MSVATPTMVADALRGDFRVMATEGVPEGEAVDRILRQLRRNDLVLLVVPLLEHLCRLGYRDANRATERAVSRQLAEGATLPDLRRQLIVASFRLPDGTRCDWLTATAGEHRAYADMLRGQAAGAIRTAELHEEAARTIEAAGATCLAEVTG